MSQHPDRTQFGTSTATKAAGSRNHREIDVVLRDQLTGCFPSAGLGATAGRVAWVLMHSYNSKEGCARPSREVIADEVGVGVRQVDNLIAEVIEFGLFTHESGRQHHANHYYPNWTLIDRLVPPDGDRQMYAARRTAYRAKKAVKALEDDPNTDAPKRSRRKLSAQPKPAALGAGGQRQMTSRAEDPCIQAGNFLPPDLKPSASRQEETGIQTRKKLLPNPAINPVTEPGNPNPANRTHVQNEDEAAAPPPNRTRDAAQVGPASNPRRLIPSEELGEAYARIVRAFAGNSDPIKGSGYEDHRFAVRRVLMKGYTVEEIIARMQPHNDRLATMAGGRLHLLKFLQAEFGFDGREIAEVEAEPSQAEPVVAARKIGIKEKWAVFRDLYPNKKGLQNNVYGQFKMAVNRVGFDTVISGLQRYIAGMGNAEAMEAYRWLLDSRWNEPSL